MFDVISFLDEYEIEYKTSGNNVTSGWIELSCPFCDDHSFHLGVNLKSGLFHCWICGTKGGSVKLIKEILDIDYSKAKKIADEFESDKQYGEEEIKSTRSKLEIPKEFSCNLPQLHREYLINRKFDPDFLQSKYKIMAAYQIGYFAYRIMVPVFLNGELVNFTGRDATGLQKTKYLHMKNEDAVIPMKNLLYNLDSVEDKIIIVEGVADVWRIGDGSAAMMGVEYTSQQLNLLFDKELTEAYILFDNDRAGKEKSEKLGNVLSTFIPHVEIIHLEEAKDPGELSDEDALKLKKMLFKK